MRLLAFLSQLFETGEITVPREPTGTESEICEFLSTAESVWRQSWPGTPPEFDARIASQAAMTLFVFCQGVVYREIDEFMIRERLSAAGLQPGDTPSAHYSADLTLRFLSDVYARLTRTSDEDPLLRVLIEFAKMWPLSAVGIPDTAPGQLGPVLKQDSMFRTYIDRIIVKADLSRLQNAEVATAVKAAVGEYDFLAPQLAEALAVSYDAPPD